MDELEIFVIPSFHWDRAWYEGFQKFRIRLVDTMDQLLNVLEKKEDYRFTLDGQTSVLDDYLEVRPERREALENFISEGRLMVGPWYVLPDEKIPAGESHIRNLLMGHKVAKEFGGVMKNGYTPDAFGHISQLPQILNGFDINTAFFWRGIPNGSLPSELVWESPDGSSVVAYHTDYGNTRHLGDAEKHGVDYLIESIEKLTDASVTGTIAVMCNRDHRMPREAVVDIVKEAKERGLNIRIATMDELLDRVMEKGPLKAVHIGELPPAEFNYPVFLPGVLSTRTYLKQANHETEVDLMRAEQLCAFSSELGNDHPTTLLERAWKYVLQNQPHDDICGCSRDVVHRDNLYRFEQAREIASGLTERIMGDRNSPRSLEELIPGILTGDSSKGMDGLVVYNPLGFQVSQVVDVLLHEEVASEFRLVDPEGLPVRHTILESDEGRILRLYAKDVPSCGYVRFKIKEGTPGTSGTLEGVKVDGSTMQNGYLKVTIEKDGSVTVFDKTTGEEYSGLNVFIEDEAGGDTYTQSEIVNHEEYLSTAFDAEICLEQNLGFSTTFCVKYIMQVPEAVDDDLQNRSSTLAPLEILSRITLDANSRSLRFETTIENTILDHRVSVRFPTGTQASFSYAEGQFDVVERPTSLTDDVYHRFLVQNYVSVHEGERGVTVSPRGLREYEATKNDDGLVDVALTLLRGVSILGRRSLRLGPAGPGILTPEAQCIGTQTFQYSFMPHTEEDFIDGDCFEDAYAHNSGLIAYPSRPLKDDSKEQRFSFLSVPEGLVLSAVKRGTEIPDRMYVRVWNPGTEAVKGDLFYFKDLSTAYRVGLNEERRSELFTDGKTVDLSVAPKEILTIELVKK